MPTPSQILERNDLHRCLTEHKDIGPFRWLPDTVTLLPTGIEFVQFELGRLHTEFGNRVIPCQLTHDPARPRDALAMQIRTVEYLIGYVPDYQGAWWQHQFDLLRDPLVRLVGLCRVTREESGQFGLFRPTCQFRVQIASLQTA